MTGCSGGLTHLYSAVAGDLCEYALQLSNKAHFSSPMNPQVGDVVCEIELEQFSVGVKVETSGYIAEICEFLCNTTKALAYPQFSTVGWSRLPGASCAAKILVS